MMSNWGVPNDSKFEHFLVPLLLISQPVALGTIGRGKCRKSAEAHGVPRRPDPCSQGVNLPTCLGGLGAMQHHI